MQKKLSYREKYLLSFSNTVNNLPSQSLDDKVTKYLNNLEAVPKSDDIYDFVDDNEKTYAILQPVNFMTNSSKEVS